MKYLNQALILLWLPTLSLAQTRIDEQTLLSAYRNSKTSTRVGQKSNAAHIRSALTRYKQSYDAMLYSSLGFNKTQQDALPNSFQAEDSFQGVLGLRKKHSFGLASQFEYGYRKLELGSYANPTPGSPTELYTPTAKIQLEMSLWQNFLGSFDSLIEQDLNHSERLVDLKNKLQNIRIESHIREFYWRYVLIENIVKIRKDLLKSGKTQKKELLARQRLGVADRADLARNKATILQRQYEIDATEVQKLEILKAVQQILGQEKPDQYEVVATWNANEVQSCIAQVTQNKAPQKQWSSYTQLLQTLKESTAIKTNKILSEGGFDLKLSAFAQGNGLNAKESEAIDDSISDAKANYGVMLSISTPLGSGLENSRASQVQKTQLDFEKEHLALHAELDSVYAYTQAALANHRTNLNTLVSVKNAMRKSLKEQRKKYEQGRLDYLSYIAEEEGLVQLEMQIMSMKINEILSLIDFFAVFDQTPCTFNYLKGAQL